MEKITDAQLQQLRTDIESGLVMIVETSHYQSLESENAKLKPLLRACKQELKKTCSCCALFKDCHLPCKINELRTSIEQALKGESDDA